MIEHRHPLTKSGPKMKALKNALKELVIHMVKSLFLIETDNSSRNLFVTDIINGVSKQKKVFENTPAWYTTRLVLTENQQEYLT